MFSDSIYFEVFPKEEVKTQPVKTESMINNVEESSQDETNTQDETVDELTVEVPAEESGEVNKNDIGTGDTAS